MIREQMIDEAVRRHLAKYGLGAADLEPLPEPSQGNHSVTAWSIRQEFRRLAEADAYQRERDDPTGQNRDWTLLKLRQMGYR